MPIYFTRLRTGYPDPLTEPDDFPHSWRCFSPCSEPSQATQWIREDINALDSVDKKQARAGLRRLNEFARTGYQLDRFYDDKRLHEIGASAKCKILRIWPCGVIRIYFVYGNDKRIILLKITAKRSNKLTDGEITQLEDLANQVIDQLNESFTIV